METYFIASIFFQVAKFHLGNCLSPPTHRGMAGETFVLIRWLISAGQNLAHHCAILLCTLDVNLIKQLTLEPKYQTVLCADQRHISLLTSVNLFVLEKDPKPFNCDSTCPTYPNLIFKMLFNPGKPATRPVEIILDIIFAVLCDALNFCNRAGVSKVLIIPMYFNCLI